MRATRRMGKRMVGLRAMFGMICVYFTADMWLGRAVRGCVVVKEAQDLTRNHEDAPPTCQDRAASPPFQRGSLSIQSLF
jgi:hypothetical protein